MLSSVAKLWSLNLGHMGIDWLIGIFRFLHVAFLKTLPASVEVSSASGRNQLDENGNPVPPDDTGSRLVKAAPDAVGSGKVSRVLENQLPQSPVQQCDGKSRRGGKESNRRTRTAGKTTSQTKGKLQKVKRNEAEVKTPEFDVALEVKTHKQDCDGYETKDVEEYFEDADDGVVPYSESFPVDQGEEEEEKEVECFPVSEETSTVVSASLLAHGASAVDDDEEESTAPFQKVVGAVVLPSRSRSRKKKKKGRSAKHSGIASGAKALPTLENYSEQNLLDMALSSPLPVSTGSSTSATTFSSSSATTRQKPSARVHPSRSTFVDCASVGRDINQDLEEKVLRVDSVFGDHETGEMKPWTSAGESYEKPVSILNCNPTKAEELVRTDSETCHVLRNVCDASPSSSEVFQDGSSDIQLVDACVEKRDASPVNVSFCLLPPVGKPSTFYHHNDRIKPQSTVNPFSVVDSTTVKPQYVTSPTSRDFVLPVQVKPELGVEGKVNLGESLRFRPRSTVNPLHVGSPQPRTKLRGRVEHPSSDVAVLAQASVRELRTTQVNEPSVESHDMRRKPSRFEDRWKSPIKVPEEDLNDFIHANGSESHHSLVFVNRLNNTSHRNCSHSNPNVVGHSVASLIRCPNGVCNESCPNSALQRPSSKPRHIPVKGSPDHSVRDTNLAVDLVRSSASSACHEVRSTVVKAGDCHTAYSSGKKTNSKPRTTPRNLPHGKMSGFRTNLCGYDVKLCAGQVHDWSQADDSSQATFNLAKAQQFLYSEFQKTVQQKRKGSRDVVTLRCN